MDGILLVGLVVYDDGIPSLMMLEVNLKQTGFLTKGDEEG